jgi:hypothetical protein
MAHIKAKEVNTVPITVVGVEDVKIRDAQEEEGESMGDTEKVVAVVVDVVEVMIHHRPPPLYHLQSGTP